MPPRPGEVVQPPAAVRPGRALTAHAGARSPFDAGGISPCPRSELTYVSLRILSAHSSCTRRRTTCGFCPNATDDTGGVDAVSVHLGTDPGVASGETTRLSGKGSARVGRRGRPCRPQTTYGAGLPGEDGGSFTGTGSGSVGGVSGASSSSRSRSRPGFPGRGSGGVFGGAWSPPAARRALPDALATGVGGCGIGGVGDGSGWGWGKGSGWGIGTGGGVRSGGGWGRGSGLGSGRGGWVGIGSYRAECMPRGASGQAAYSARAPHGSTRRSPFACRAS